MRICYVTQAFVRHADDAIGSFIFHLAEGVAASGAEVTVVAPHAAGIARAERIGLTNVVRARYAPASYERIAYHGAMRTLVKGNPVNVALSASLLLALAWGTIRTVRRQSSGVIHAHWWFPSGVAGAIASVVTGVPLIVTCHGSDVGLLGTHRVVNWVAARVFRRASAVTVVSRDLAARLVDQLPELAGRVSILPMPVNSVFTHNGRRAVRQEQPPSVLAAGRLSAQKGIDTLIKAVAVLRERGVAVRADIAGEGEEEGALRQLTDRLGVADAVHFLGLKTAFELAALYRQCDVAVLSSHDEGLGLTLIEAMYSGAPVVGSRSGGICDVISDGVTGLLAEPDDPLSLADALARLLADEDLARRLGHAGQAFVREHYDPSVSVSAMLAAYRSVAGCAGASRDCDKNVIAV